MEGEASMAEASGDDMEEFVSLVEDVAYIDLKDPWLRSP